MSYATPELLLVGSAQSLVLGNSTVECEFKDNPASPVRDQETADW